MLANVARSYLGLPQIGKIFSINGKDYIKIQTNKGDIKQVRAYSTDEYKKYYPDLAAQNEKVIFRTQKEVLGFKNNFITIFKGNTYQYKDWFIQHKARYTKWWGWSFGEGFELPKEVEIPKEIEPIKLEWSLIGANDSILKPDEQVKEAVERLLYDPSPSKYIGTIGDRLDLQITVIKSMIFEGGYYGPSTMHIMESEDGNIFVWTTNSKCWEEGSKKHIRGTIKDYKTYHGVPQTILTRCTEIKEKLRS